MTKEQFVHRVNILRDLYDKELMLSELGVDVNELTSPVYTEYMAMLSEAMNDIPNEAYGTELEYFCFERDFGEEIYEAEKGFIIKSTEDLYDYLISRKNN